MLALIAATIGGAVIYVAIRDEDDPATNTPGIVARALRDIGNKGDVVARLREIATKGTDEEVTTEEMRQAMVHARALFNELVQPEVQAEDTNQKEKM